MGGEGLDWMMGVGQGGSVIWMVGQAMDEEFLMVSCLCFAVTWCFNTVLEDAE